MSILLEIPVDCATALQITVQSGADRIELCSALSLGGLTPSVGLMQVAGRSGLPICAMIRPRAGDFHYSPTEVAVMLADIAAARSAGCQGVVFGALNTQYGLDWSVMQDLVAAAKGMEITLHRAFDLIPDWRGAIDQAVELGISRILTSGQAVTAPKGVARLAEIFAHAADRVIVMPGAGISADTLPALAGLPIREIHASCCNSVASPPPLVAFGFAPPQTCHPDPSRIEALRGALAALTPQDAG